MRAGPLVWASSLCAIGVGFVRHAVCEIDNKYHSFSTNLAVSGSAARHQMAKPLRPSQVILVTGGTGFLGQHIVKLLQERADHVTEIRVFDTKPFVKKLEYESRKPLQSIVGDLRNKAELTSAVAGVDAVIHTAGLISFGTFPDVTGMEEVNVKGTQNVIDACVTQNVPRLIYTSTVDVAVGFDDVIDGNEEMPVPGRFLFPGYPDTKYRAECEVVRAHGRSLRAGDGRHLRTLALRPNVMFGELDPYYVTNGLREARRNGGTLYRVGNGSALFQPAYVGNVAWCHLVALAELERLAPVGGNAYFLPDDTPLTNTFTFMAPFLEDRGFRLSRWYLPYPLVYAVLRPLEALLHLLGPVCKIELPVQLCSVVYINRNLHFSRRKAARLLHYAPLYSYAEAMRRSRPFYAQLPLGENKVESGSETGGSAEKAEAGSPNLTK